MTLGQVAYRSASANSVTTSWLASVSLGWTPQTGDALALLTYLDNGTDVDPVSLSIGGHAVTVRDKADAGHGGTTRGCGAWLGTVRSLPTGSPLDVVLTTSGTNGAGHIAVWLADLVGWGGSLGGHAAGLTTGGLAYTQSSSAITLTGSGGLLVGIAGTSDADAGPLTAAGWTRLGSATVGTAAGTSLAAAVWSRTGGDAGTTATLTAVADLAWSEWAAGLCEIL